MNSKLIVGIIVSIFSLYAPASLAALKITEVMPCNLSTISGDDYNFNGYVEIYNDGDDIDLRDWTVINKKGDKENWKLMLDSTHVLRADVYNLIFFGEKETSSTTAHLVYKKFVGTAPQKLCTEAGEIMFTNGTDTISMSYPQQYPHLAYYKQGYMIPSPGKRYETQFVTEYTNRVQKVNFEGNTPGLYDYAGITVALSCNTDSATIFYTTDGSIPTSTNGMEYEEPIVLDKSAVIRVRAYRDSMLYSEVTTGSYIMPDVFHDECATYGERLPIVSISTDPKNFFDDTLGIYVKGTNGIISGCYNDQPYNFNQDWTRPVNFEYILNGKVVDNQELEVGVYGGCTRIHNARSLKLKATKRTGDNRFQYRDFFKDQKMKRFKSLALRNGGNGYSYIPPRWRDMYMQSLADGLNVDKQSAQPVAYYINGEYWGLMILTERTDEDYTFHNYGLDKEDIDLLGSGYEVEHGSSYPYNVLLEFVDDNYQKSDFVENINLQMDVDEYVDYQILEQFVANTDWVANNMKIWRKRDGGRFRWILYDTDFGLSNRASAVDTCMLDFATEIKGSYYTRHLLQVCMKNEDFRWLFLDQFLDRIDNHFTNEFIVSRYDSISKLVALETCAFTKIGGLLGGEDNLNTILSESEEMRDFALKRRSVVTEQLKKEFALGDSKLPVKIKALFPNGALPSYSFLFNKRKFTDCDYERNVFANERVKIEPIVPAGFRIAEWMVNDTLIEANGQPYTGSSICRLALHDSLVIKVTFKEEQTFELPELFINEVCSSNASTLDENGNAPDWIELYNNEDYDVDISGLYIENKSKTTTYQFPYGHTETIVPAHGYVLLWADKDTTAGPLHLNFKLSATLEQELVLKAYDKGVLRDICMLNCPIHPRDASYGRLADGSDSTLIFVNCTEYAHNKQMTPTPASSNGKLLCDKEDVTSPDIISSPAVEIFAADHSVVIENAWGANVKIFDEQGRLILAEPSVAANRLQCPVGAGMYVVVVNDRGTKIVVR
ncbi:MAG TPA: CotH kinase family protein [Paludibacteraceae bacterium]|jgi:hypothetical protein|nr:CotH kinase family protein [Paludibacteraceae bacterium]HOU67577.1 CotH kinase family protein [Paludibacteraceae bacterium]HPH62163.1 CotH kinase family protein [Paludibacteraceae bacterium]HQF49633.1 CotH kinase family protein [Paludibacteraceae bacterium]